MEFIRQCMQTIYNYRNARLAPPLAVTSTIPVTPRSSAHYVSRRARSGSVYPNCGRDDAYGSPRELQKVRACSDTLSARARISRPEPLLCGNFLSTVLTDIFSWSVEATHLPGRRPDFLSDLDQKFIFKSQGILRHVGSTPFKGVRGWQ